MPRAATEGHLYKVADYQIIMGTRPSLLMREKRKLAAKLEDLNAVGHFKKDLLATTR